MVRVPLLLPRSRSHSTGMTDATCPICGGGLSSGEPACPGCGFPLSLREDAVRAMAEAPGPQPPIADAAHGADRSASQRPDPVEPLANDLGEGIATLRAHGMPMDAYVHELQRAAVAQADGHPADAVSILRAAIAKLSEESRLTAQARLVEVEARRARLASAGILDDLGPNLERVHREIDAGQSVSAYDLLESSDAVARQIEEDSVQLRATLAATEELWAAGTKVGLALTNLTERVAQLRRYLAEPSHSAPAVATASRSAHELLMLLRVELANAFTAELAHNAEILSRYPVDHPGAQAARHQNAEATARTHDGGYPEAAALLVRLRRTTDGLPPISDAPESPPAKAAAPAAPSPRSRRSSSAVVTKATLVEEVRLVAARVRVLPPGTEVAVEAARDIRRATELVMHDQKLEEAHDVLLHLIATLDAARPPKGTAGPV